MAHVATFKVVCTLAETPYNVASGTTSAPTTPRSLVYVGQEATFQNQTSGSLATIGASDVVDNGGLILDYLVGETVRGNTPTSVQLQEWWVSSDTPGGIVVVQLRKLV